MNSLVSANTLIFGTFKMSGSNVADALKAGYTFLDTATGYKNIDQVGIAIKNTNIKPFVITKFNPGDFASGIELACQKHDQDLTIKPWAVLLHSPLLTPEKKYSSASTLDAYKKLMELYPDCQYGVSNFCIKQVQDLLDGGVPVNIVSLEYSPYYQPRVLAKFCHDNNIWVTGYRATCKGKIYNDENLQYLGNKKQITSTILKWISSEKVTPVVASTNSENIKNNLNFCESTLSTDTSNLLESMHLGPSGSTCMLNFTTHDE
jgi:diketogulonate reductase-like aldo/keto reductase